ncbi:hypothetical protein FGIG_08217, partial [Fasciola gigantica]
SSIVLLSHNPLNFALADHIEGGCYPSLSNLRRVSSSAPRMKTRWWNSFVISGGDYTADTLLALCYIWFLSGLVYAQTIPMPKNEQLDRKQQKADLFTSTPTQNNTPVDRMYFDEVWKIRLHPSVSVPVPRAPFPTFGMLLPLPKSWFCTKHFFPVVADAMRVKIYGATNYIVESAARRFEALVRSRTGLSSYSVKWSHQQSQLPELARLYLSHSILADHFAGTAGADPNLATTPTGSWPAKAVELLWQRFAVYLKPGQPNGLQTVSILVGSPGLSWPSLEMDESYILTVTAQGILLYANETWGALHGLTSLAQLLWKVTNTSQVRYSIFSIAFDLFSSHRTGIGKYDFNSARINSACF